VVAMFVNGSGRNEQFYREPSIDDKHGRHRQFLFLIGRFLKIFSSETAFPNEPKHGRMHLWKVAMFVNVSGRNEQSL
jgi:hypothetical protein